MMLNLRKKDGDVQTLGTRMCVRALTLSLVEFLSVCLFVCFSGLSVTESSVTWVSYYQVIVSYAVTSGGSDGLYVLGLPSTTLSTPIVDVGTQPYTGSLTWLNGTFS